MKVNEYIKDFYIKSYEPLLVAEDGVLDATGMPLSLSASNSVLTPDATYIDPKYHGAAPDYCGPKGDLLKHMILGPIIPEYKFGGADGPCCCHNQNYAKGGTT